MNQVIWKKSPKSRRYYVGGSDARIIMGADEAVLLRLWQEKRGEVEPEDLSGNLLVQLGLTTEELNRRWYEVSGHRRSEAGPTSGSALDGGHLRRSDRGQRYGL